MAWPPSKVSLPTVLVETFASWEEKISERNLTGGRVEMGLLGLVPVW